MKIINRLLFAVLVAAIMFVTGCGQVESYEAAFFTRWGEIISRQPLPEGLHVYEPFGTDLICMDCRNQVVKGKTEAFTKDIQSAGVEISVTYSLVREKAIDLYRSTGTDYTEKLVIPAVYGAVKNVIGQLEADGLVAKRKDVANQVQRDLMDKLNPFGIGITLVEIMNIDYSDAFEKAVEQKQVAMQDATLEKNNTQRLREVAQQEVVKAEAEAKARVLNAEADAKAMLVKAESEAKSIEIRNKALASSHALIEYETVKTWDGHLPVQMLGSAPIPFLNLPQKPAKVEEKK